MRSQCRSTRSSCSGSSEWHRSKVRCSNRRSQADSRSRHSDRPRRCNQRRSRRRNRPRDRSSTRRGWSTVPRRSSRSTTGSSQNSPWPWSAWKMDLRAVNRWSRSIHSEPATSRIGALNLEHGGGRDSPHIHHLPGTRCDLSSQRAWRMRTVSRSSGTSSIASRRGLADAVGSGVVRADHDGGPVAIEADLVQESGEGQIATLMVGISDRTIVDGERSQAHNNVGEPSPSRWSDRSGGFGLDRC